MGIASLLLISLFLIQLIPSLGVKVKAEEKTVNVTVTFTGNDKFNPLSIEMKFENKPSEEDFKKSVTESEAYKTQKKTIEKDDYSITKFDLDTQLNDKLDQYFASSPSAVEPITVTVALAQNKPLNVAVKFLGADPAEAQLDLEIKGNQVIKDTADYFIALLESTEAYKKRCEELEGKNYSISLKLDNPDALKTYVEDKTKEKGDVTVTATLTKNKDLKVIVNFKGATGGDNEKSFNLKGSQVTTSDKDGFIALFPKLPEYYGLAKALAGSTHYVSSLTLDQGQDDILAAYVKDKTKAQTVTMTATLTPLEPIKVNVTVMVDGTLKSTFDLSIPAADVTKPFETEIELKDFVGEHKDFKDKIKGIPHDYKKDYKWQYSEQALENVNQYIKDGKKKDVEISIVLSYPKENATTTTTTTKPSTHKPSRMLTSNLNKYGYRMGSLELDPRSNSPELPDKLKLTVESEPLSRSFASKAKVPVPQGDHLIAQYFNVSTTPSINLSKYDSTLTLNIDERASSSAITVYQRVPGSKIWNRISRSNYSYDKSSGELKIEDLDDLGEFVVWINKDAKEPLDPRPLQRLPLNPSVQVKPNGMLPQGVAPFKPANPQVQGSLMPQVPQVNPNAQLPVTGEKNYIGIMMGTLILACGALILRKAIK